MLPQVEVDMEDGVDTVSNLELEPERLLLCLIFRSICFEGGLDAEAQLEDIGQ